MTKALSTMHEAIAIAGIRGARLRNVGVMPTREPGEKTHVVAAVPIDPTGDPGNQLDSAMQQACAYWPDCDDWTIGDCDTVSRADELPPGFVYMHQPGALCQFSSDNNTSDGSGPEGL